MNLEIVKEDFEREIAKVKGVLTEGNSIDTLPRDIHRRVVELLTTEWDIAQQEVNQLKTDIEYSVGRLK